MDIKNAIVRQPIEQDKRAARSPPITASQTNNSATGAQGVPPIEVTKKEVAEAVTAINSAFQNVQRDLLFSVDDTTGKSIIKVIDQETQEVIRQIPPDELLKIAERLDEVQGLLFHQKV